MGGESAAVDGEVLLYAPLGPTYHYGDRIRGTVRLRDLPPGAPAELRDLLQERGIAATGTAQDLKVLDTGQGNSLRAAVGSARTSVDRALARALDEPLAGLAQGIATGRRGSVQIDLQQALNATSLTHLVVVSGSNVTMLAALLVAALAWLIGRRWAVAAALATIGAYTVFVGADAPVVRAAIMAGLFLAARLLGRPTSAVPAIAFAAAVMVAVSPGIVGDLSFQLSFAATAWLALLAPTLQARVQARIGGGAETGDLGARMVQGILEIAVVTAIATAATLPLLALHFGRISLIALPANLLVAPAFPFIFLGSLLTGAVGAASTTAGEVVGPGWRIDLGAEVTVAVAGPIPLLEPGAARSINNGSLVLLLRHGTVRFLLAADIEAPEEVALGLTPGALGATVLKVAHHGSRTSTTELFLRRVDPAVAVISAGAGNPFGHPHSEVLERLASVEVLRTNERGTITFRSDGIRLRYSTERAGEP